MSGSSAPSARTSRPQLSWIAPPESFSARSIVTSASSLTYRSSSSWPSAVIQISRLPVGGAAYDAHGTPLTDETMAKAQAVDAVLLGAVVLLTAAAVALAGPVGFVGLLVPHALRRLRPPSTRALMVGCALWGAVLLVAADAVGRVVLAPAEIHVGVSTVLLGVPVLLGASRKRFVSALGVDRDAATAAISAMTAVNPAVTTQPPSCTPPRPVTTPSSPPSTTRAGSA